MKPPPPDWPRISSTLVDAHCAHVRANGAEIVNEPVTTDHGPEYWVDRSYGCRDPGGHYWWFGKRLVTRGRTVA